MKYYDLLNDATPKRLMKKSDTKVDRLFLVLFHRFQLNAKLSGVESESIPANWNFLINLSAMIETNTLLLKSNRINNNRQFGGETFRIRSVFGETPLARLHFAGDFTLWKTSLCGRLLLR
jgi:hypothetical protein